jgi:PiT family inorganic phosphate transporter
MIFLYLTSGLFLGWSLGANDAANVFGTAVGTKMVQFRKAAFICTVFVILGAVLSGAGASHTLGKLGAVNELAGAFIVALAAGLTVTAMTRYELPVSTSQAVVGAIIGWNFFSGSITDYSSLTKIFSSWVMCPILSAVIAALMYKVLKSAVRSTKIHLFKFDTVTRIGLILVGAFGSFSLGANNIANVMGVFVKASPFHDVNVGGLFNFQGIQQLFLIGSVFIGIGVYTYSKRVMHTVGAGLLKLTPLAAFVVVLSHSIVLFLFASASLENWLLTHGLPASQAVVGAVLGIGFILGAKGINYSVLARISTGWVTTPVISFVISFVSLFFMQNVFSQQVFSPVIYVFSPEAVQRLAGEKIWTSDFEQLRLKKFKNALSLEHILKGMKIDSKARTKIMNTTETGNFICDLSDEIKEKWYTTGQWQALKSISGKKFMHKWQIEHVLSDLSHEWKFKDSARVNKLYNKKLKEKYYALYTFFSVRE